MRIFQPVLTPLSLLKQMQDPIGSFVENTIDPFKHGCFVKEIGPAYGASSIGPKSNDSAENTTTPRPRNAQQAIAAGVLVGSQFLNHHEFEFESLGHFLSGKDGSDSVFGELKIQNLIAHAAASGLDISNGLLISGLINCTKCKSFTIRAIESLQENPTHPDHPGYYSLHIKKKGPLTEVVSVNGAHLPDIHAALRINHNIRLSEVELKNNLAHLIAQIFFGRSITSDKEQIYHKRKYCAKGYGHMNTTEFRARLKSLNLEQIRQTFQQRPELRLGHITQPFQFIFSALTEKETTTSITTKVYDTAYRTKHWNQEILLSFDFRKKQTTIAPHFDTQDPKVDWVPYRSMLIPLLFNPTAQIALPNAQQIVCLVFEESFASISGFDAVTKYHASLKRNGKGWDKQTRAAFYWRLRTFDFNGLARQILKVRPELAETQIGLKIKPLQSATIFRGLGFIMADSINWNNFNYNYECFILRKGLTYTRVDHRTSAERRHQLINNQNLNLEFSFASKKDQESATAASSKIKANGLLNASRQFGLAIGKSPIPCNQGDLTLPYVLHPQPLDASVLALYSVAIYANVDPRVTTKSLAQDIGASPDFIDSLFAANRVGRIHKTQSLDPIMAYHAYHPDGKSQFMPIRQPAPIFTGSQYNQQDLETLLRRLALRLHIPLTHVTAITQGPVNISQYQDRSTLLIRAKLPDLEPNLGYEQRKLTHADPVKRTLILMALHLMKPYSEIDKLYGWPSKTTSKILCDQIKFTANSFKRAARDLGFEFYKCGEAIINTPQLFDWTLLHIIYSVKLILGLSQGQLSKLAKTSAENFSDLMNFSVMRAGQTLSIVHKDSLEELLDFEVAERLSLADDISIHREDGDEHEFLGFLRIETVFEIMKALCKALNIPLMSPKQLPWYEFEPQTRAHDIGLLIKKRRLGTLQAQSDICQELNVPKWVLLNVERGFVRSSEFEYLPRLMKYFHIRKT